MSAGEAAAQRRIAVLHLEHDPFDGELVEASLEVAGVRANVERVEDWRAFRETLTARRFDLVLLDYNVPGVDGLTALSLAQRMAPDTPIVVVSGELGEERAVEVIKCGAADYVRKERLHALPASVARALREAEERAQRRAAEEALRAREAEFRRLAESRAQLLALAERARAEAEASSRAKDEFLAVLSHELRTPLHAIVGWVRLLREGRLDEARRAHAEETIERNALAQVRLIDDLLDVSRIITGTLRIDPRSVEAAPVLAAAVDAVRPSARAKGVELAVNAPPRLGGLLADPERLQQVVWNLLSNAVKFTPPGGRVTLEAEAAPGALKVVVRDTGRGINPEFLPHIFDRFRQEDGSYTRAHGGLGLGLAIARHLTEQHGGTLEAASEGAGRGATFTLTIPRGAGAADVTQRVGRVSDHDATLDGVEVLVVDDDPDARELIEVALSQYGARVTTAGSVREARAVLARLRPRVVLSDLGMPGEDGYALLGEVQELRARTSAPIRVIALTGFAGLDVQQRALDAGFDRHLTKPVDLHELVTAVTRCARG